MAYCLGRVLLQESQPCNTRKQAWQFQGRHWQCSSWYLQQVSSGPSNSSIVRVGTALPAIQYSGSCPLSLNCCTLTPALSAAFGCSAFTVTVAAPSCQAARLLRGRFDNEDDPSGYAAYTAARAIDPLGTKVRNGNTPEAAESTSNAAYLGECHFNRAVCNQSPHMLPVGLHASFMISWLVDTTLCQLPSQTADQLSSCNQSALSNPALSARSPHLCSTLCRRLVSAIPASYSHLAPLHAGVYRASTVGGQGKLSFATVEATHVSANPDRRKEVIKPRTRSAQDLGNLTPRPVNIAGGAVQVPVLVTNGASVSQT